MDNKKESKILRQLKTMQPITLPPKEGGYTISEIVMTLNIHLNLGITGDTKRRKVISRKLSREFKRNKIPFNKVSERKRYYKISDCDNMLNGNNLRVYLLGELYKSKELAREYENYEKRAQDIAIATVGPNPPPIPAPTPLSDSEVRQQIERVQSDIAFFKASGIIEKHEKGMNLVFEKALKEAKQCCLLDALSRLMEIFELDEELLGYDVWNSFVEDNRFPESYDLASADRLKEPWKYYNLSRVEALWDKLSKL